MPNRFQSNQYRAVYPLIAERDGEYCLACFIESGVRRGPKSVKLEIDHADGDRRNWSPANLHLLCRTHNIRMRSLSLKAHLSLMATYSAENERVRVRKNEHIAEARRGLLYQSGSPEMQVNSIALAKWLQWMHEMIDANGSISKEDAICAGAIAADDVDIQTTARYLKKHTSVIGRFKEIKVGTEKRIVYRDPAEIRLPRRYGHDGHRREDLTQTVEHKVEANRC